MSNDKIDDNESLAQTLRPKVTAFSQRPTIPIPTNIKKPHIPWYRQYLHYIIIILTLVLVCEIIFIAHNVKSKNIPAPTVTYNIPAIIELPEQTTPIVTPSINLLEPKPVASAQIFNKPIIKNVVKSKDKDYGI